MATASEVLALARAEIETKEYPPGSNNVKYNTAYYGREVSGSGFSWCAVFIWWLFREAGISGLYYGGQKMAYVPTLMSWAKKTGLIADTPQLGDLICFDFNSNGVADHIGICESFDGTYVTTIDGNTGTTSEANGGCVMRRRRHKKYILAVIRPEYERKAVDNTVTYEQWKEFMEQYRKELGAKKADQWAVPYIETCIDAGIMSEVNSSIDRPADFLTRQEGAVMMANTLKAAKK